MKKFYVHNQAATKWQKVANHCLIFNTFYYHKLVFIDIIHTFVIIYHFATFLPLFVSRLLVVFLMIIKIEKKI